MGWKGTSAVEGIGGVGGAPSVGRAATVGVIPPNGFFGCLGTGTVIGGGGLTIGPPCFGGGGNPIPDAFPKGFAMMMITKSVTELVRS